MTKTVCASNAWKMLNFVSYVWSAAAAGGVGTETHYALPVSSVGPDGGCAVYFVLGNGLRET